MSPHSVLCPARVAFFLSSQSVLCQIGSNSVNLTAATMTCCHDLLSLGLQYLDNDNTSREEPADEDLWTLGFQYSDIDNTARAKRRAQTTNARVALERSRAISARSSKDKRAQAQQLSFNVTQACTQDQCFTQTQPAAAKAQRRAAGQRGAWWKKWLPVQALRICFSAINMSNREAARQALGSGKPAAHRHVKQTRYSVTDIFCEYQTMFLGNFNEESHHKWLTYNLQFDETTMTTMVGCDRQPPASWRIMLQHGLLSWKDEDDQCHTQDLLFSPSALYDGTADTMYEAINLRHRGCLPRLLQSARLIALLVNADSASVNKKVYKWFSVVFASLMMIFQPCLQHQVALVLVQLALYLEVLGPLYTCASQLRQGDCLVRLERAIAGIIQEELVYNDVDLPNDEDRHRLQSVLSITISPPCPVTSQDDDEVVQERRRCHAECEAIKRVFNRDIRARQVGHNCIEVDGKRCCKNRQDCVDKMVKAVMSPLKRRCNLPALNKWGTISPLAGVICLMLCLHRLIARGLLRMYGRDLEDPHESGAIMNNAERLS